MREQQEHHAPLQWGLETVMSETETKERKLVIVGDKGVGK